MNALVIDDNIYVLEGIESGVDFEKLGIENVYTAQNIRQAKDILSKIQIDIMLSDIEMPQGTGLELLEWVRENNLNVQTIICTSYADFNYAQKAVELHSFDYYLKPIAYDKLTAIIEKAIKKVNEENTLKTFEKYGQYWLDNQKNNKDHFWNSVLYCIDQVTNDNISKSISNHKLEYTENDHFLLMLLNLSKEEEELEKWGKTMFEYGLKNIVDELFTDGKIKVESILRYREDAWSVILKTEISALSKVSFGGICQNFIENCNKYLQSDVTCYFSDICTIVEAPQVIRELEDIFKDNVCTINHSFYLKEYSKKEIYYSLSEIEKWEVLLRENKTPILINSVNNYLDNLAFRKELNMSTLKVFRIDMMQMIHAVLKQKHVEAYKLYADEVFDKLREKSLKSVPDMKKYIKHIVEAAINYLLFIEQSQSVIDKVKEYIDKHIDEDVTRASLSEIVYLNSDYLSRLFKKETGKSIVNFLLDKRIDKAKELLRETDMPICTVSLEVGYDNFSYFSKLFKEKTQLTPIEYRKNHQYL